ncbi:hypothetical protein GC102_19470 [Paenibacillus sp. LMG 31460]|uniref:Uncharacterized protein n=1 Tax=Paenibacillus germinis TaxID=2654979 RepID=A0ABX1Z3F7_9BACL|nr:hypothetical protein [Paenibacillus germinis]NOU87930.1 hypothetical protein [Paenibacillus germinis]
MRKFNLIFVLLMFFVLISSFYYVRYNYQPISNEFNIKKDKLGVNLSYHINEITNSIDIQQNFKSKYDGLNGIEIFFSTFNRKNTGTTVVELIFNNEIIRKELIPNNQIEDNKYRMIYFDSIKKSKGTIYNVRIYSIDTNRENAVTVWLDETKDNNPVILNSKSGNGQLVANLNYNIEFNIENYLVSTIILLFMCYLLFKMIKFLRK